MDTFWGVFISVLVIPTVLSISWGVCFLTDKAYSLFEKVTKRD